jgi:hypothetical protein
MLLSAGVGTVVLVLALIVGFFPASREIKETVVEVTEIQQSGKGEWSVSRDAAAEQPNSAKTFVMRLKHLRAERMEVDILHQADDRMLIRADELAPGDVLVRKPELISRGQALMPAAGLDDERSIRLILEAGIAAAMAEDVDESVRFLAADYRDDYGFNRHWLRLFLKRAYKEFDGPRIFLTGLPAIEISGSRAVVSVNMTLDAIYRGRRNYLLGDGKTPNHVLLFLNKSDYGWKVSRVQGLNPLGFDEKFLRLLGAEVGLPLSEAEMQEKNRACMPCRDRMAERFGPEA